MQVLCKERNSQPPWPRVMRGPGREASREALHALSLSVSLINDLSTADSYRVQCLPGYNGMNPSRLGMRTLGSVSAFIASFSPMILLSAST